MRGVVAAVALVAACLVSFTQTASAASDGTVDTTFGTQLGTGFDGFVNEIALQDDGKIVAAGFFFQVNGTPSQGVARLNADGSVDTAFSANVTARFSGSVRSVASQSDGKIVLGGDSLAIDGVNRGGLVRLNVDGTVDDAFSTQLGTGFDKRVHSVAVQSDGKILVGGEFTSVNGTSSSGVARLNADGSVDGAFSAQLGTGVNVGGVYAVTVQVDGQSIVGGPFQSVNGTPSQGIARLNSDGSVDTAFSAQFGTSLNAGPFSIVQQVDGKILVGGYHTPVNGDPVKGLIRLNIDGSIDSAFLAQVEGQAEAIALQGDGMIIVGGSFVATNGISTNGLVRLDVDGNVDAAFAAQLDAGFNGGVSALGVQGSGDIIAGGSFTSVNGITSNSIARLTTSAIPPSITTVSLPDAVVALPYSVTLQATGDGPLNWAVTAGALPQGLALDAATGVISGTPVADGSFSFTVTATGPGGAVSRDLTLVVAAAVAPTTPPGPTTAPPAGTLAATGSDSASLLTGVAVFAAAAGLTLTVAARRRWGSATQS